MRWKLGQMVIEGRTLIRPRKFIHRSELLFLGSAYRGMPSLCLHRGVGDSIRRKVLGGQKTPRYTFPMGARWTSVGSVVLLIAAFIVSCILCARDFLPRTHALAAISKGEACVPHAES